jgi:hypothetical protein
MTLPFCRNGWAGYRLAMSRNHDHHTPRGPVERFDFRLFQKF